MPGRKRLPIRRQSHGELIGAVVGSLIFAFGIIGFLTWLIASGMVRPLPGRSWMWLSPLFVIPAIAIGVWCANAVCSIREMRRRAVESPDVRRACRPGNPSRGWNESFGIDPDVPVGPKDRRIINQTWRLHEAGAARAELRLLGYDICVDCGFWLRGLGAESHRCPECGRESLPAASGA